MNTRSSSEEGSGPRHIVPFYSERTLERIQSLVKDFPNGLAVFVDKEKTFATIGTRGIRPLDGSPGLIIHASVCLDRNHARGRADAFVPAQPFSNLEYAPIPAGGLLELLIATLAEAGFVPSGATADNTTWSLF